jgi:hypothetical protein
MTMIMTMATTTISCFYGCGGSAEGCGLWVVHCALASVLLFRDIKISFGAFASTDSYVDLFSTPENTRHKDAPARFHLAPKGHLLVCSATVATLPEDVLLAAKKATPPQRLPP